MKKIIPKKVVWRAKKKPPTVKVINNSWKLKIKKALSQWNKNINIYIGAEKLSDRDKELFFGFNRQSDRGEILLHYEYDVYLATVLRDIGIAKSIAQAGGAGWLKKAEDGFSELILDGLKLRKENDNPKTPHRITILKRTPKPREVAQGLSINIKK